VYESVVVAACAKEAKPNDAMVKRTTAAQLPKSLLIF